MIKDLIAVFLLNKRRATDPQVSEQISLRSKRKRVRITFQQNSKERERAAPK